MVGLWRTWYVFFVFKLLRASQRVLECRTALFVSLHSGALCHCHRTALNLPPWRSWTIEQHAIRNHPWQWLYYNGVPFVSTVFFNDWMRMVLPYKIQDHSADNITCLQSMSISCSSGKYPHLDWYVLINILMFIFLGYFHVFPKIGSQIIPNFTILALKAVGFGYPHGRTPRLNRASWSFGKPPSLGPCWAASSADKAADILQICLENWDLANLASGNSTQLLWKITMFKYV